MSTFIGAVVFAVAKEVIIELEDNMQDFVENDIANSIAQLVINRIQQIEKLQNPDKPIKEHIYWQLQAYCNIMDDIQSMYDLKIKYKKPY